MGHRFIFTVSVELNRTSGKFATRDEMAEAIISEIEGAEPGEISGIGPEGDTEYTVDSWEVEES